MSKDWKRLAEYAHRRRAELGLSQAAMAVPGVLSIDRIQKIEGAKRSSYRLGTLLALERALKWAPGSVEAILSGGEPTPLMVLGVGRLGEAALAPGTEKASARKSREDMTLDELLDEAEMLMQQVKEKLAERRRRKVERLWEATREEVEESTTEPNGV